MSSQDRPRPLSFSLRALGSRLSIAALGLAATVALGACVDEVDDFEDLSEDRIDEADLEGVRAPGHAAAGCEQLAPGAAPAAEPTQENQGELPYYIDEEGAAAPLPGYQAYYLFEGSVIYAPEGSCQVAQEAEGGWINCAGFEGVKVAQCGGACEECKDAGYRNQAGRLICPNACGEPENPYGGNCSVRIVEEDEFIQGWTPYY